MDDTTKTYNHLDNPDASIAWLTRAGKSAWSLWGSEMQPDTFVIS